MKTQNLNFHFFAGAFLLFIPAFFFLSDMLEQMFNSNFLIENIFVRIDKISGLISAFLMVGLPFMAICINTIPLMNLTVKRENNTLKIILSVRAKILNIVVVCAGFFMIVLIMGYLFTENYMLR